MVDTWDVKIARVEEGLIRIHQKIDSNHKQVMETLRPVTAQVVDLHDFKVSAKANSKWVIWLAGAALALSCASLERGCSPLSNVVSSAVAKK